LRRVRHRLLFVLLWSGAAVLGVFIMSAVDSPALGVAIVFAVAFCVFLVIGFRIRRTHLRRNQS